MSYYYRGLPLSAIIHVSTTRFGGAPSLGVVIHSFYKISLNSSSVLLSFRVNFPTLVRINSFVYAPTPSAFPISSTKLLIYVPEETTALILTNGGSKFTSSSFFTSTFLFFSASGSPLRAFLYAGTPLIFIAE